MSRGNWKSFWADYRLVEIKSDNDLLYQVGKTISGKVINDVQFGILVQEVVDQLQLNETDSLLDLCCGNGVLTKSLAPRINKVIGIDFSEPYIRNANKYCSAKNTEYILHDINNLTALKGKISEAGINKVLIYDALAYLNNHQLQELLRALCTIQKGELQIMLAAVLDRRKIGYFFNTLGRKLNYLINMKLLGNTKGLGTWWRVQTFEKMANDMGLKCTILPQDMRLHTAHYRMNVLLSR